MAHTTFRRLNSGWNAEPNAPAPQVRVVERTLYLSFRLNSFEFPFEDESVGELAFRNCSRYRLGATNDEGWYSGKCRFSQLAPAWGEFYEVSGDLLLGEPLSWTSLGPHSPASRHFLFYLRDETFECDAEDWSFAVPRA